jgi:membrane protein required for colicin V production
MNYIDIILAIPIIWFAFQGFKRGFVVELASLAALILGIYAALHFSGFAVEFLHNNFDINPDYIPVIAFIITFIIVVIVVHFIGKILEKIINMVALGFLNKLAGAIFGFLKAVLIISIIMLIINHFNEDFISKDKKNNSLLYNKIEGVAPALWMQIQEWDLDDSNLNDLKESVDDMSI